MQLLLNKHVLKNTVPGAGDWETRPTRSSPFWPKFGQIWPNLSEKYASSRKLSELLCLSYRNDLYLILKLRKFCVRKTQQTLLNHNAKCSFRVSKLANFEKCDEKNQFLAIFGQVLGFQGCCKSEQGRKFDAEFKNLGQNAQK